MNNVFLLVVCLLSVCECLFYNHTHKPSSSQFISELVNVLHWDVLTVVFDDDDPATELLADDVTRVLNDARIKSTVYQIKPATFHNDLIQIHSTHFPKIQVLYLTSDKLVIVSQTMKTVNDIDFKSNRTTDFRIKSKWILMTYANIVQNLVGVLNDLCHVSVITQSTNGCFDIRTLEKKVDRNVWTPVRSLQNEDFLFPNLKFKFNGRKLLLGTSPFYLVKRRIVNGRSEYFGWMINVLDIMATVLNFTYILQEPKDGQWGVKTGNNTWNGLIGELHRREIDILYAELLITKERSEVMDFIQPAVFALSVGIFYRNNQTDDTKTWLSLLRPFSSSVYLALFSTYLVVSILYISVECFDLKRTRKPKLYMFLNLFGCLCLEGSHIKPRTRNGKILYVAWWIVCVIITASYTGQLTSSLLIKETKKPFTNLRELAQHTTWTYGLLKDSAIQDLFQHSRVEEYKNIWNGIVRFNQTDPTVLSDNMLDLKAKALTSNFAIIDVFITKYLAETTDCGLTIIDNILGNQYLSFSVGYNSPIKEDLQWLMHQLTGFGLLPARPLTVDTRMCSHEHDTKAVAVSLNQVKGIFAAVGIGLLLAACGLVAERCIILFKVKLFD